MVLYELLEEGDKFKSTIIIENKIHARLYKLGKVTKVRSRRIFMKNIKINLRLRRKYPKIKLVYYLLKKIIKK